MARLVEKNICIGSFLVLMVFTGCSMPDETMRKGARPIPHQSVAEIPEAIRSGEQEFTGIIVYGDRGYTGISGNAYYPNIRVDDLPAGKCEKRRAIIIPLEPGAHVVSAHSENDIEYSVNINEGDIYYFRCSFMRIGGILFPPAVLEKVDPETAYLTVNGN